MKRIFGRCADIIGHLPTSLLPSEKLKPEVKLPVKEGKKGFRVVIYDLDSPSEEGVAKEPIWDRPISLRLIPALTEWIKIHSVALQYRRSGGSLLDGLRAHWASEDGQSHNPITGQYRQVTEEYGRRRAPVEEGSEHIDQPPEEIIREYERGRADISRRGNHIERALNVIRSAPVESPPGHPHEEVRSTPDRTRGRWEESIARHDQTMQDERRRDDVDDITLSYEFDPREK